MHPFSSKLHAQLSLGVLVAALLAVPLIARAQEAPDDAVPGASDVTSVSAPTDLALVPLPPRLEDLPGMLLVGSTRASAEPGDSIARYRLYTLNKGQFSQLHVPDEALGSTSAALSPDGRRLLLDAGGQAVYLVDLMGAAAPRQLGERLPPLSFAQTDAYLSVAWSQDGNQAIIVRPYPKGMALLNVGDGATTPLPIVAQMPSFSPDGKQIAVAFTPAGLRMASIYTAPSDHLDAVAKLSSSSVYETIPQWLPDGSGLIYVAAGDRWEVRKAAASNTSPTVLAQAPSGFVISDLAAAPDGAWVAFTLQSLTDGHRVVHISSTTNPSLGLDLPQERPWNDRVLGWVQGS